MDKKSKLGLIVATTPNGEIGYKGTIPWKLDGDLPRFKDLTMGNVIISGRSTHESMPESMPGRIRIVVTRSPEYASEVHDPENHIYGVSSVDEAIELAKTFETEWIYFVGGASIYEEALGFVETVFLTLVHKTASKYDTVIKNFRLPANEWARTFQRAVNEPNPKAPEFETPSHTYYMFERIEQQPE
jgi:dihydrofolate reductase